MIGNIKSQKYYTINMLYQPTKLQLRKYIMINIIIIFKHSTFSKYKQNNFNVGT